MLIDHLTPELSEQLYTELLKQFFKRSPFSAGWTGTQFRAAIAIQAQIQEEFYLNEARRFYDAASAVSDDTKQKVELLKAGLDAAIKAKECEANRREYDGELGKFLTDTGRYDVW
jgi:hypothetical protein